MADYHRGCVVVRDLEGKPNAELAEEFFNFLKKNGQNGFENGWQLNKELSVVSDVVNPVEKIDIQSGTFCDYTGDYASYHAVGTGLGEGTACRTEDYEKWIFKTMKDFNGEKPKCNLIATTVWDDEANLLFSRFYCAPCGTREFHMWDFQLEMEDGGDEYGTVFVDGDEQVHDCPDDSPDSIIENFGAEEEEEEEKEEEKGGLVYSDGMKTVEGVAKKDITEAVIPDGVREIGWDAFSGCTSLASVVIPASVTAIGVRAFDGCTSLAAVTIPESVTNIADHAFRRCAIEELNHPRLTIKGGVAVRKGDALYLANAKATEIKIPEGVTRIYSCAFKDCTALQSVAIPESVTQISNDAFSGCTSLASVTIPASVTKIDNAAFKNCAIEELNHPCLTIKGGISVKDGMVLYCANAKATEIKIPDGVTKIGNSAFSGCTSLASVAIPASMTEIDYGAFRGCASLAQIAFGGTVEQWNTVKKGGSWNMGVPAKSVKCADGEAAL